MRKIWLYVDGNGQLCLSFYDKHNEEKVERQYKGRQCYKYIEKLCNGNIKQRKNINNIGDISLIYSSHYIDIFDVESVLKKYGTTPILDDINIYECTQNAKRIKQRKVQRKNKYLSVRLAATGMTLTLLGTIAISNFGDKKSDAKGSTISIEKEIDDLISDEPEKEEIINLTNKETNNKIVVKLDYRDKSDEKKAYIAKSYYGKTITKYANQYGVDPTIMIAIATQERGIHSEDKDKGGATGLMQIQNNSWKNKELTAFNYNTNQSETIVVDEDELSDVYYNIKVGCMIFQNNLKEMKNNVIAAIQCYNMGYPNMKKILETYSNKTGKSINEILFDIDDYGWLDYRYLVEKGDDSYVENVICWIGENAELGTYTNNGKEVDLVVTTKTK